MTEFGLSGKRVMGGLTASIGGVGEGCWQFTCTKRRAWRTVAGL